MTLTLRRDKGSALTYSEVDDNFVHTLSNFEGGPFRITANNTFISFYSNNSIIGRIDVNGNLSVKGDIIAFANTAGW